MPPTHEFEDELSPAEARAERLRRRRRNQSLSNLYAVVLFLGLGVVGWLVFGPLIRGDDPEPDAADERGVVRELNDLVAQGETAEADERFSTWAASPGTDGDTVARVKDALDEATTRLEEGQAALAEGFRLLRLGDSVGARAQFVAVHRDYGSLASVRDAAFEQLRVLPDASPDLGTTPSPRPYSEEAREQVLALAMKQEFRAAVALHAALVPGTDDEEYDLLVLTRELREQKDARAKALVRQVEAHLRRNERDDARRAMRRVPLEEFEGSASWDALLKLKGDLSTTEDELDTKEER